MPGSLVVYRNTVAIVGLLVLAVAALSHQWIGPPGPYLLFVGLFVLIERMRFPLARGDLSLGFALALAAFVLWGSVPAAVLMALGYILGTGLPQRRPLWTSLFNVAQLSGSVLLAGWLAHAVAGEQQLALPLASSWLLLLVFTLTHLVANTALVSTYFSLAGRELDPRSFWEQILRWNLINHVASSLLGGLLARAYLEAALPGAVMVVLSLAAAAYILRIHIRLDAAAGEMQVLYDFSSSLAGTLDLASIFGAAERALSKLVGCDSLLLYLVDSSSEETLDLAMSNPATDLTPGEHAWTVGSGLVGRVAHTGREELVVDLEGAGVDWRSPPGLGEMRSLLLAPLAAEGSLIGVLVAASSARNRFNSKHLQPMVIVGSRLAMAIQAASVYQRTQEMSVTDSLTGLGNYRHFHSELSREIQRAEREGTTVGSIWTWTCSPATTTPTDIWWAMPS